MNGRMGCWCHGRLTIEFDPCRLRWYLMDGDGSSPEGMVGAFVRAFAILSVPPRD